jgi:hypothetical protein
MRDLNQSCCKRKYGSTALDITRWKPNITTDDHIIGLPVLHFPEGEKTFRKDFFRYSQRPMKSLPRNIIFDSLALLPPPQNHI